jgi:uncharacterized protein YjbI with pentapeptide repeats
MSDILSDSEYTQTPFKALSYSEDLIERTAFYECRFENCTFAEVRFVACRFYDCVFKDCDLSLATVSACVFSEATFEQCKLVGVNWAEMSQDTLIQKPLNFFQCVLNYSTFIGLTLKGIRIAACVAWDVDFSDVDLREADCQKTDFAESHFRHTDLTRADFTDAKNYAIDPEINALTGAKFSLPEAINILRSMDIELTE